MCKLHLNKGLFSKVEGSLGDSDGCGAVSEECPEESEGP